MGWNLKMAGVSVSVGSFVRLLSQQESQVAEMERGFRFASCFDLFIFFNRIKDT